MTAQISPHKSGYVAIIGEPNSGKSTLLNALLKDKVSIVSSKPQTTLRRVFGILNARDYQVVFIDTPGIFEKLHHRLDEELLENIDKALKDSDVIILLIGQKKISRVTRQLIDKMLSSGKPYIVALNKVDELDYDIEFVDQIIQAGVNPDSIIYISARTGRNLLDLLKKIVALLPEGPKYYDEDIYTTQSMRNIVSEIIREKIFHLFKHEIPHCVAVMTDAFKERDNGVIYIHSNIYVEKESQKKIIIGEKGKMLKKVGMQARKEIEEWLGQKVYLELFVKVAKNWRKNNMFVKEYLEGVD